MGCVARGGLRWSDRREDFRTEILGLMKAQNVKNTLIVPVGANGGFVVKRPPAGRGEDVQAEVVACYQTFIRGLLDLTDNIVAGLGDMSGDLFGNGMLLSRHIRLQAAFDHRHIFIDPDPDPAASFAARARLFALPRSSWDDYDRRKLSRGGGIFARTAKSIAL